MKKICILGVVIISMAASPLLAAEKVKQNLYPPVGQKRNPISISFEYEEYSPPIKLSAEQAKLAEPEKLVFNTINSNKSGTPQDIIDLFCPDEREKEAEEILNKEIFDRNRSWFKYITDVELLGKLFYGDFIIIFAKQHHEIMGPETTTFVVVANASKNACLTNKLAEDRTYLYLINSLKERYN